MVYFHLAKRPVNAQSLDINVATSTLEVDSTIFTGYLCTIDFEMGLVKKEWWRYIKSMAVLENHKSHYILSIPPKPGESNAEVKYISKTVEGPEEGATDIKLALNPEDMSPEYVEKYSKNAGEILADFQLQFYSKHIQANINAKEKEAAKVSSRLDKLNKRIIQLKERLKSGKSDKAKLAVDINANDMKKRQLLAELRILQLDIEKAKKRLTEIK